MPRKLTVNTSLISKITASFYFAHLSYDQLWAFDVTLHLINESAPLPIIVLFALPAKYVAS